MKAITVLLLLSFIPIGQRAVVSHDPGIHLAASTFIVIEIHLASASVK